MFRRFVFLVLGVLECLAAVVLAGFALGMPGAAEVHDGAARVEDLTGQTSAQVARLRDELHDLREQRPKFRDMADNLRTQTALATNHLKDQGVDYDTLQTVEEAIGDMAKGLDGLAEALDADAVRQIADGFKSAADLVDAPADPEAEPAPPHGDVRELSRRLRQAQKGLEAVAARWPELRKTLGESARLLRATQAQMQGALAHRDDYEKAMKQTVTLARTYSAALPLAAEQLDERLRDQEDSLQDLGDSIDRTTAVLPEWDRTAARVLETTRLLLFLMAAIFGLHGSYLTITAWGRGRRLA